MNKQNSLKGLQLNSSFFITALILNGLTGFIMLSYVLNRNILQLFLENSFMLLVLSLIELIWFGFALYKQAKKKNVLFKDFIYILCVIPIFAFSFLGQLGNSEAFTRLFGTIGGELYNTYIIIIHVYTIYILIKKR